MDVVGFFRCRYYDVVVCFKVDVFVFVLFGCVLLWVDVGGLSHLHGILQGLHLSQLVRNGVGP